MKVNPQKVSRAVRVLFAIALTSAVLSAREAKAYDNLVVGSAEAAETKTLTSQDGEVHINDLNIASSSGGISSLTIDGANVLADYWAYIGRNNAGGNASGEGVLTLKSGSLTTGYKNNNDGSFRIAEDLGKGTFNMEGGELKVHGEYHISAGSGTKGYATISGGEVTVDGLSYLGKGASSEATMNIGGDSTDVDVNNEFYVGFGQCSTGVLSQTGGRFTPKKLWVGSCWNQGQQVYGKYQMTGGYAATDADQDFVVGGMNNSTGVVQVSNGTISVGGDLYVPWSSYATGRMTVGDKATVNVTKQLILCNGENGDGKFSVNGGTVNVIGATKIALGANSTGVLEITGGKIVANGEFWVGAGGNASATVNMTGGILETKSWLALSRGNTSVSGINATFNLSGGAVTNTVAHVSIGSFQAPDSTATFNVSGGELYGANDIYVGENHNGTLTISGTGKVITPANVMLGRSLNNGELNLAGGSLTASAITRGTSTGTTILTFNGGTFNRTGSTVDIIASGIPVSIGAKGGTINIGSNNATVSAPVAGSGTLTIQGSGSLTFSESYAGGLAVASGAGNVTTPGNQTLSPGQDVFLISKGVSELTAAQAATLAGDHPIWFESTGRINLKDCTLDFSSATEQLLFAASSMTIDGTAVAADTDVSTHIHVLNATAAHKVVFKSDGIYAVADLIENKWVGEESGDWSVPSNWSEGVPTETSHVVFESNAVVSRSDNDLGKKCWIKLTLRNNAQVELRNSDPEKYPSYEIGAGSLDGTGALILTQCGLTAKTSNVEIPSTIKLVFQNTNGNIDGIGDCWLNDIGVSYAVTVNGPVEVSNYLVTRGGVVFNGAVTIKAGSRLYAGEGSLTVNGAVTIEGNGIFDMNPGVTFTKGESATLTETETDSGTASINRAVAEAFGLTTTDNTWIGGSSGNWRTAYNWRYGVPAATQKVHVKNDCIIYFDGNWDAGKDDTLVAGVLVVDAVLTTQGPSAGAYKRLYLYGIAGCDMVSGTGSVKLSGNTGLENYSGAKQQITCPIEFATNNDHTWLGGVSAESGWEVTSTATVSAKMQCDIPVTFRGDVVGSGIIDIVNNSSGTGFSGDNSRFTGTLNSTLGHQVLFLSPTAGLSNASKVNLSGSLWLWFAEGVITFGGDLTMTAMSFNRGINILEACTGITMVVGANNGKVEFLSSGDNYAVFQRVGEAWNMLAADSTLFKLQKVGSGVFTNNMVEPYQLEVQCGKTELKNNYVGTSPIKVASGAEITGGVTVSGLNLANGAIVSQTVTKNGGSYSCPTLTVNGSVDASGVKAKIANADFITGIMSGIDEEAKTALKGTTFTLLSSTSMTGTPNPAVDGLGSEWYAVAQNTALKILFGGSYSVEVADESAQPVQITDPGLAAWLTVNSATGSVNTDNGKGVTGIMAYMLGAENYTAAQKPVLGATVADGMATLTFDNSKFRNVAGLKLKYYIESSDNADFSGEREQSEASDSPAVELDISNAKIYNRLCAEVHAAE